MVKEGLANALRGLQVRNQGCSAPLGFARRAKNGQCSTVTISSTGATGVNVR